MKVIKNNILYNSISDESIAFYEIFPDRRYNYIIK